MASQTREKIKVYARIRPSEEKHVHRVVEANDGTITVNLSNDPKSFQFDGVFGEDTKQDEVFDGAASRIVHGTLQGYNGTIFAYGQTGSGKTHTMIGPSCSFDDNSGIIPRGLQLLFEQLERKAENMPENFKSNITISFVEIYKEHIYDLFAMNNEKLKIGQDNEGNAIVKGVTEVFVKDLNDAMQEVMNGWHSRKVAETAMNIASSRSHALLMIKIHTEESHGTVSTSRSVFLNLVDLAGSERVSQSKVEGERLKETAQINKSLHNLTLVIRELSENKKNGFVPFRNSVLTHILKDSLGGNARTAVMINIHPDKVYYSETLSTLQFSSEVRRIENKVVVNEDLKGDSVLAFKAEIRRLKEEMRDMQNTNKEAMSEMERQLDAWKEAANKFERQLAVASENTVNATIVASKDGHVSSMLGPLHDGSFLFPHAAPPRKRMRTEDSPINAIVIPDALNEMEIEGEEMNRKAEYEQRRLELELQLNDQKMVIDELSQKSESLSHLLKDAEKRIVETEEKQMNALESIEDEKRKANKLIETIERAERAVGEEREKIMTLERREMFLNEQLEEAKVQMLRIQSDSHLLKSIHEEELKALETRLTGNLSDKKKKEVNLISEVDRLRGEVQNKTIELQNKETEKQAAENLIPLLRERLVKAEEEIRDKSNERDSLTYRLGQMEKVYAEMEAANQEMEEERQKREEAYLKTISSLERELEKRKNEMEEERRKMEEIGTTNSAISNRLRKEREEKEEAANVVIAQKEKEIEKWKKHWEEKTLKLCEMEVERSNEKKKRLVVEARENILKETLKQYEEELAEMRRKGMDKKGQGDGRREYEVEERFRRSESDSSLSLLEFVTRGKKMKKEAEQAEEGEYVDDFLDERNPSEVRKDQEERRRMMEEEETRAMRRWKGKENVAMEIGKVIKKDSERAIREQERIIAFENKYDPSALPTPPRKARKGVTTSKRGKRKNQ